jgi:hypothetical protein
MRSVYKILAGNPEIKGQLRRHWLKWEDNIKMNLREIGFEERIGLDLAIGRDR